MFSGKLASHIEKIGCISYKFNDYLKIGSSFSKNGVNIVKSGHLSEKWDVYRINLTYIGKYRYLSQKWDEYSKNRVLGEGVVFIEKMFCLEPNIYDFVLL